MNNIEKTSHIELLNRMDSIDKKIDLLLLERELIRLELVKRIPTLENEEVFKPIEKHIKNRF